MPRTRHIYEPWGPDVINHNVDGIDLTEQLITPRTKWYRMCTQSDKQGFGVPNTLYELWYRIKSRLMWMPIMHRLFTYKDCIDCFASELYNDPDVWDIGDC